MTGDLVADRYRMEKRLGAGGMATVFLAKDCRLERDVAIKRLHAESPEDVGIRFQREAKVGASLNHPNMVAVFDTVTDDEGLLIVMEYVAGHTLREEIARGPMEPGRALEVLTAVAGALDHAHEHGVVHRDVKPANVLIDEERDIVKLADLGIASAAERTRITHSGSVLGTAAYMAPERLDGGAGGPSVDVYALAAMAFEMLSGRKAIEGATALEIARRVATQEPPYLCDLVESAPTAAGEALKRALAKSPEGRQASAGELVRELSAAYAAQAEERNRAERAERERQEAARRDEAEKQSRTRSTAVVAPQPERTNGTGTFDNGAEAHTTAPRRAPVAAPAAAAAPAASPVKTQRGRRRGWLLPATLALATVLLLGVLAVALTADNGGSGSEKADSGEQQVGGAESSSPENGSGSDSGSDVADPPAGSSGSGAAPGGDAATGATPAADPSTPNGAVTAFYKAAAGDDYDTAWGLATPEAQNELGGRSSFEAGQSTLESIDFPKLDVSEESGNSATVDFRSVARHKDWTDRCTGRIGLVRQGGSWKLSDFLAIDCQRS